MEHGCVPAPDAAKRDALAYKMHLVIPLATGMEKVHWVKWEQIAFILYLESYSRHSHRCSITEKNILPAHLRQEGHCGFFCFGGRVKMIFFSFKSIFLLGHFVTMTKCPKVCVLWLFGEVWGPCETGPCPLWCLDPGPKCSRFDDFQMWNVPGKHS